MGNTKFKMSAGTVAFMLAILGWVLRFAVLGNFRHEAGTMNESSVSVILIGGSVILALVSGCLGLFAAIKKDGLVLGLVAIVLACFFAFALTRDFMTQ